MILDGDVYKAFSKNNLNYTNKLLYIGGMKDYNDQINTMGFKGVISRFLFNDVKIDLLLKTQLKHNVGLFNACEFKHVCEANEICVPKQNKLGYKCRCFKQNSTDATCDEIQTCKRISCTLFCEIKLNNNS